MTRLATLLALRTDLAKTFASRAADLAVSGDMLLAELREAGIPAGRSAVFAWRKQYRVAARHRPNSLASRVASALLTASTERLAVARLPAHDTTAAVFKLGRKRLYAVARLLGLYPTCREERKSRAPAMKDG